MSKQARLAVIAVILLVAAGAAFVLLSRGDSGRTVESANTFYYDLQTGTVFEALPDNTTSVTRSAAGNDAAEAFVFSCSSCDDDYYVGYVRRVRPEVVQKLGEGKTLIPQVINPAGLSMDNLYEVAAVTQGSTTLEWVAESSPSAATVRSEAASRCDGEQAVACDAGVVDLPVTP